MDQQAPNRNGDQFPWDNIEALPGRLDRKREINPQFKAIENLQGTLSGRSTYTSRTSFKAYDPYRKSMFEDLKEIMNSIQGGISIPKPFFDRNIGRIHGDFHF
jgi:hypothetical protein